MKEQTIKTDSLLKYWGMLKSALRLFQAKELPFVRVEQPDTGRVIYVNPRENRGKVLTIMSGVTQPRLHRFWSYAVAEYKPTLVLDVGVNYGECLFSRLYRDQCRVFGIEANPNLHTFLERSLRVHPNKRQIRLINAIASDQIRESSPFFVHKYWSGVSAAVIKRFPKLYENHRIPSVTVDSLFDELTLERESLLFKIDVEGHEYHVLKGMLQTISRCGRLLGYLEFNTKHLHKTGTPIDEFLCFLSERFDVYAYLTDKEAVRINGMNAESLHALFAKKKIHTDLILASAGIDIRQFGLVPVQAEISHRVSRQ